ncbi:hypothetical protein LXL04_036892 [Taraxacum kok-saghyz]
MSLPTPRIHHPPLRKGDSNHSNHFVSSNPIDNDTTTTDNNKTLDEHPASSPDSRTDDEDDGMIDGFRRPWNDRWNLSTELLVMSRRYHGCSPSPFRFEICIPSDLRLQFDIRTTSSD